MYNEYKEDSIMTEDTRKFVEEKTKEILNAGSCCPELKDFVLITGIGQLSPIALTVTIIFISTFLLRESFHL